MFNDGWGMGRPEKVLFGEKVDSFPWRVIFRQYYRALPDPIRLRVIDKASAESLEGLEGAAAFAMAGLLLLLGPAEHAMELVTARGATTTLTPDLLAVLCLLAALILLFRYVQLFAEWRRRIFVLYAEAD